MARQRWIGALLAFAIPLLVYLRTLHPGLPGPDSAELITVAHTLGIAHPPGYPLYTLVAHAFDAIVGIGSVAWRLNLLSALLQSAAALLLCLAVTRLTSQPAAGLVAALSFALARSAWKGALVAEVFPLNDLMAAGLWLGFVGVVRDTTATGQGTAANRPPWPVLLLLATTLAIPAHHHSLVLLAVPLDLVALALLLGRPPALVGKGRRPPYRWSAATALLALACGIAALAPLLYLPLAAAGHPAMDWGDLTTPAGFLWHLSRGEYGTFSLAAHARSANPGSTYLRTLPWEFGWWSAALALVGAAVLAIGSRSPRGPRPFAIPLLAVVLGETVLLGVFFARVGLPIEGPYANGILERFHPLPHVTVALLAGIGAAWLIERVRPPARGWVAAALVGGALIAPWITHARTVDQAGNTFNEDLGRNVLASLPRDAVLFSLGDLFSGDLNYLTLVEHRRQDVAVVDQAMLARWWYVRSIRRRFPDLLPAFTATADPTADAYTGTGASANVAWIDHLEGRRPIAFLGELDRSYASRYTMVEHGLVQLAYPVGREPSIASRARASLDVLAGMRLDSYFRRQDPTSAEADARWRVTWMLSHLCMLLCEREAQSITRSESPGLDSLARFLDRYEGRETIDDPELLRASGFVHVFHPAFRDAARASSALTRYLTMAPPDERADGARRLLAAIRSGGN